MSMETELKFDVPGGRVLEEAARLDGIAGYRVVDRGLVPHTDTYFDTMDYRLFHGRAVFRLRSRESGSTLTFKTADAGGEVTGGGLYRRIEIEDVTDVTAEDVSRGNLPDIPPVRALRERFGEIPLFPCLTVRNNRRVLLLEKENAPRFEMVLDDVLFSGPGGEERVFELEVEALTGDVEELERIGSWLTARFDLGDAGPSKYIRGMKSVGFAG